MALAQAMPMPTFVARCLEEIGLEGRCGLPVRDMFALVDDVGDLVYRRYAWKVLRAMGDQVTFHYMLRSEEATAAMSATSVQHTKASAKSSNGAEGAVRREKRRRKWSTTLMHVDEGNDQHAASRSTTGEDAQEGSHRRRRRRRRLDSTGSDCVVQQEQEEMQEQEEEEEERDRGQDDREGDESQHGQEGTEQEADISVTASSSSRSRSSGDPSSRSRGGTTDSSVGSSSKTSDEDKKRRRWITRSPRGYELGEELDVTGLSYEDAISETPEGVLGIVACEELRLKYLGVVDPSVMDTASPQFDLLEMIGRAREEGLNAAHVTESRMFGDARKLHYLLDMLIASGFAVKNIISADQKRFNILHLTRFAARFHPSMISPTATLERDGFPKDKLPHLIAQILVSRGERTCVFADIGREFGYSKRHQEKLRKYFFHQMHIDADFPLELFMARCNTGSDSKGRKLWCVRVKSTGRVGKTSDRGGREHESGEGPVLERGIMEQVFSSIQERGDEGATIPEIRDVLGVPTFKLPYKLAQGLISNYNLGVEQVVLGKSTMYRMFAPGVVKSEPELLTLEAEMERVVSEGHNTEDKRDLNGDGTCSGNAEEVNQETLYQPSTLKEATRGLVVTSTVDRRRQYILDRVGKEKIVSIHQLRSGLVEAERLRGKPAADVGQIDIRSVRRIVDELETAKAVVTMDITLPPKRVLQKSHKVLKCVALPDAQRDRDVLRQFIDNYLEEQQRRFMENMDHENDAFIVVSNRSARRKSRKNNPQPIPSSIENREVVKYTAASYKMARVNLVKLHKQGRRLGMFFGVIYRCKALHLLLWDRVPRLQRQQQEVSDTVGEDDNSSPRSNKLVFGLKEILDMLSVREYIQIVGVSELLTEAEENKVRMAIVRGDSWEALTLETCEKIRACEADRFSKLLRVLIELGLLHVVNESSYDLLSAMRRSTEDFDQVISHVAFATLSGGLFELRKDAHISLKRGSKPVKQLPNKNSYVYAAGFTGNNRGEQVTGRIPLDFAFDDAESVSEYWKTLQFLSLEGARLGNGETESTSVSLNVDAEPLRPVPLRDHNLFVMKVWVPRATTNYRAQAERAKAVADVVDQETKLILKRKRFQSSLHSGRVSGRSEKVQRKALKQMFSSAYEQVDTSEGTREATASRWRQLDGWGGARSRIRAAKWSPDDDMKLMDLYIEKLSTLWFIDVPLALQKGTERVAFRSTKLSRTKILWKLVADVLGRKREDCILRVRELLSVPAVQARVEKTKQAITRAKNPGGQFHEELEIISQPRLTSLLCRALQIVFHEGSSYYSVLADMLISAHWREAEVKLVWRYLWLSRVISRTTKANQGEKQRQRGFGMHAHVFETKSLQIPHYSIEFFCDAAEYASFLQQNVKEAEFTDDDGNADSVFERDIEQNAPGGQIAVDLTALLLKEAAYVPEYTHTAMSEGTDGESCSVSFSPPKKVKSSPTLQESKRSLAIKGFAGHLSKKFDGAQPDDFLKDFWSVKGRYGLSGASDGDFMSSDHLGWTRAFSSCDHTDSTHPAKLSSANVASTMKWLLELIESKGPDGLTLTQVKSNFQGDEMVLNRAVEHALGKRSCIEVNGAEASRLVSIKHARMWTLKPYRVATDSTEENVHFVFEKNRPIVSHPWLHLDGSTNSKVLLMFKRRLVNIVMCSPGIPDRLIHQKMNRALTLQETRCLLDELVKDEVLYGRVTRHDRRSRSPVSIFDVGSRKPDQVVLFSITPGQLRNVDNVRDALFYFPSVNCVELLGAEASDVDLGRTE